MQCMCNLRFDAAVLAELVLGIPKDALPVAMMVVIVILVGAHIQHCA